MYRPLLSLLAAFAGYSLLNISQAGQKIGLGLRRTRRVPGLMIWTAATFGTLGAALLNLYALSIGSVSLVGAMAGSGLASLSLFSWLVMKEPVSFREFFGIGILFAAAALIGAFARPSVDPVPDSRILYTFIITVSAACTILWSVSNRRDELASVVIAGFSGALGGFVALFQKLSTTELGRSRSLAREFGSFQDQPGSAVETFSNPYTLAWIGMGMLSMAVLQFAYRRGKAVRIIPWFSAAFVVVPILGGLIVFDDRLHPFQWVGVILMIAGVLVLTLKPQGANT